MRLGKTLSSLIARCESLCSPSCCGLDAYDFSPLHIASFLIMHREGVDANEILEISEQLDALSERCGKFGVVNKWVKIEGVSHVFSVEDIDEMVREIKVNLEIALFFIKESEFLRFKGKPL